MKIEQLGRHILAEFYNCDKELLNDHKLIEKFMVEAAEASKATVVKSVFHLFNPWGVSGVVVIQESHLTIHTWPEYGYAAVDFFTCGDEVNPWVAFQYMKDKLKSEITETTEVPRGLVDKIKLHSNNSVNPTNFKASV